MIRLKVIIPISHLFKKPTLNNIKLFDLSDTLEIKFLPEPEWLPRDKKRVFHANLGLVESGFRASFDQTLPYLEKNGIDYYGCDLGPAAEKYEGNKPIGRVLGQSEIEDRIAQNVEHVRKGFRGRLAVENYNYFPTGLYDYVCEPGFITRMTRGLDLGLVLDLAHAMVTAHNLGLELLDYLKALPLDRLTEIHVSRPKLPGSGQGGLALDSHNPPGRREYAYLYELIDKILPRAGLPEIFFVVEYYKNSHGLYNITESAKGFCEERRPLALLT
ncbi:MAG: DUF692 family protein [Deltaproteobacteria bacterium]|jgi:hypothetical protein|nr:DUF692 family protein [Deltaproteobacteria bacterium]